MSDKNQSVTQMQGTLSKYSINEDGDVFNDGEIQKPVNGILTLVDRFGVTRRVDNQLVMTYYRHLAESPSMETLSHYGNKTLFNYENKPNFVMTNRGGELHMEQIELNLLHEPLENYWIDQHSNVYNEFGAIKEDHGFVTLFDEKKVAYKISVEDMLS